MDANDPRHGTYAGFHAHGRDSERPCEPCKVAQRRYFKQMNYRLSQGHRERVTLGDDAWAVIDSYTRTALSNLSGVRPSFLSRLHSTGPTAGCYQRTRQKILAAAGNPAVTPIGIQRRLRALTALGYSAATIARHVGMSVDRVRVIQRGATPTFVRQDVAERIRETYDQLAMTPPPSSRSASHARNRARRNRWATPFAWDRIDDASERPKGTSIHTARGFGSQTWSKDHSTCPRCGVVREVRVSDQGEMCRDCKAVVAA